LLIKIYKGMSDQQPERVVFANRVEYRLNGNLHREDGPKNLGQNLPAVEWENGSKEWWINNHLHRLDGPALYDVDESKEWWIDGKKVSKADVDNLRLKILTLSFVINHRIWSKVI